MIPNILEGSSGYLECDLGYFEGCSNCWPIVFFFFNVNNKKNKNAIIEKNSISEKC